MKNRQILIILVFLVGLAGCTGIELTGPGSFDVQKSYQVSLGKPWSAYPYESRTHIQELTIDGMALNALSFASDVKDGDALIYSADPKKLIPRFRSDMSESEVIEFIKDTLAYNGLENVEVSDIRPESFGTLSGIRFDMSAATQRGLNLLGTCKAAIEDGRLHFILFTAPSEHYYGLHIDEVNTILDSVRLL